MGFFSSIIDSIFGETPENKFNRLINENPFRLRLLIEPFRLDDGTQLEVLKVQVCGFFDSGLRAFQEEIVASSVVIQAGASLHEMRPVICAIEDFQYEDTPFFHLKLPNLTASWGAFGGWPEWITLVTVPIASLTFPRKGKTFLRATYFVSFASSNLSFQRSVDHGFLNQEIGYLDSMEQRVRAMEIATSMAVLVSGVDGIHHANEISVVKRFISTHLNEIEDPQRREETKIALNKATTDALRFEGLDRIKAHGFSLAKEASGFQPSLKFMIMQLLLDVAKADGVAEGSETEFLNAIAQAMQMDIDEYRNMRDREIPVTLYASFNQNEESEQLHEMLGLSDEMSSSEKRVQLSKEYRKWNALKNSSDAEKARQAKEMVRVISNLRKSL